MARHWTKNGDLAGCTLRHLSGGRVTLLANGQPTQRIYNREVVKWGKHYLNTYYMADECLDCVVSGSVFEPLDEQSRRALEEGA